MDFGWLFALSLSVAYLASAARTVVRSRAAARPTTEIEIRPARLAGTPVWRAAAAFLAGAGWALGWAALGFPQGLLIAPLLFAGLSLQAVQSADKLDLPRRIDFLSSLLARVGQGEGFFAALSGAAPLLGTGRARRSVADAVTRHEAGESLTRSLVPLLRESPVLRDLAADVATVGESPSPALLLALDSSHLRAAAAWEHTRRWRSIRNHLLVAAPWLSPAALGAAATGTARSLPVAPGQLLLAAACAALLYVVFSPAHNLLRTAAVGTLILFAGFGLAASQAAPAAGPVRQDSVPVRVRTPRGSVRATEFPVRSHPGAVCVVTTGLPGGWARLRAEPGMGAHVLAYLQEGSQPVPTGEAVETWADGAWRRVRTPDGLEGWIYAALCPDASP